MRPQGSAEQLEQRRRWAARLLEEGLDPPEVAQILGTTLRSVQRWDAATRDGDEQSLAAVPHAGARPKLSPAQGRQVISWLERSPSAFGFATERWTAPRVARLIVGTFGVSMNHRYLNDWLRRRGDITPQIPRRQAAERDEAAIERWKAWRWPRIKKRCVSWAPRWRSATRAVSCCCP